MAVPWVGLPRASRLLAMFRPAEYAPVTNRSRILPKALGQPELRPSLNNYIVQVIGPLRTSDWYRQPLDQGWSSEEQAIWRYRMALVDMLVCA